MNKIVKLSIVIPCYNEQNTLEECVKRVLEIRDNFLEIEIIIVDDGSTDSSREIIENLSKKHKEIITVQHDVNQGKGAALRTGFRNVKGEFVAVQDADLEYDPKELIQLLIPLIENKADIVFGSRFLSSGAHRVLYFWHSLGNRFLTFLSNMFTDLNLTDMETCYKVFKSEIIKKVDIKENRFGFEPEIVAKIAHMRLRIYEMGISYYARTYSEGKKIGWKDGIRAIYCIFRYNAHKAPVPIQLFLYTMIGGFAAIINVINFTLLFYGTKNIFISVSVAFIIAAIVNYLLCILVLFRHKARWNLSIELLIYIFVVAICGIS